jgi:hypothetical protein
LRAAILSAFLAATTPAVLQSTVRQEGVWTVSLSRDDAAGIGLAYAGAVSPDPSGASISFSCAHAKGRTLQYILVAIGPISAAPISKILALVEVSLTFDNGAQVKSIGQTNGPRSAFVNSEKDVLAAIRATIDAHALSVRIGDAVAEVNVSGFAAAAEPYVRFCGSFEK